MDFLEDLRFRGLLYQVTDEDELKEKLNKNQVTLYAGFDPTANSLHIGSLLPILTLRRFQLAGHKPIALVGGGTGLIGDPSGRTTERQLSSKEIVVDRVKYIKKQLEQFIEFDSGSNKAQLVNNYDWLGDIKMIDFMRDVGKFFPLGYMLSKDSVKSRMEAGISFTEFTYMILQAYDFLNLKKNYHCDLQIGGSDQWGNITAGIELIRRMELGQAWGLTFPLVTKTDGTKFGKTESGTIWLDASMTSPYQFYQFWINTDDRDVLTYLKYFTFLTHDEINNLEEQVKSDPGKREAQNILADEVTTLVHGKEALESAKKISQALFYGNIKELSESELEDGFHDIPSADLSGVDEIGLIQVLVDHKISSSNRQAREDISNGSIYINGERQQELNTTIKKSMRLFNKYLVVRRGKKKYFLIKWQ
ncbi:MAG: tyrosine--tRNA ligase [Calditrichaceae bacterium]|nr:tyrosine--tRNA ligase [Calditrichaceae bacterium]